MALWEYKVITSGLHGFASLALLEAHLNALGKDEWEIINFQTQPNNPLAFHGLARRSTTRDWTPPEPAVVTAPKPHAPEPPPPAAKPAASTTTDGKPELPPALVEAEPPKTKVEDTSLRPMRNTERDLDPDAEDDEELDDWDNLEEDELPTLFEAIKPHLRRNQKGPGMSVAIDYLAKRWDQKESDIAGALKECGFSIPETEEADPEYFEFEGDLYWVNRNNRGQMFLNTREKPRPTFRTAPVKKLAEDDPAYAELAAEHAAEKAENEKRRIEREERAAAAAAAAAARDAAREAARAARQHAAAAAATVHENAPAAVAASADPNAPAEPIPSGEPLLDRIRPLMRRNRRGPGHSGSISFLARALKTSEADLVAALAGLGLNVPANAGDKPVYVEIAGASYWMNKDNRGGIWINGREKREGGPKNGDATESGSQETAVTESDAAAGAPAAAPDANATLAHEAPAGSVTTESATPPADALALSSEAPAVPPSEQPAAQPASVETAADGVTPAQAEETVPADEAAAETGDEEPASEGVPALAAVRPLLKPNKKGSGVSGEVGFLARSLEKPEDDLLSSLTGAGLSIPADSEEKPAFVESAGEIFWLNKNANDGSLWLNAKAARSTKRPARSRAPRKPKPPKE